MSGFFPIEGEGRSKIFVRGEAVLMYGYTEKEDETYIVVMGKDIKLKGDFTEQITEMFTPKNIQPEGEQAKSRDGEDNEKDKNW